MTITEFITANLDRIEQTAREATPGPWEVCRESGRLSVSATRGDPIAAVRSGDYDLTTRRRNADAAHIALHDPAHVLAWVAAIRAVVAAHPMQRVQIEWDGPGDRACRADDEDYPCPTIRAIAGIWADTDGWQEEWR